MSTSCFHPLLISVEKMNLLPSSIYMHLKTNSIKHMQSLILGEVNLFLCSVIYLSFYAPCNWKCSVILKDAYNTVFRFITSLTDTYLAFEQIYFILTENIWLSVG